MMHQWLPLKGYIPTPTPEPGNVALLEKRISEEVIKLRTRGEGGAQSLTDLLITGAEAAGWQMAQLIECRLCMCDP